MIRLTFHSSGPATQAAEFKRWMDTQDRVATALTYNDFANDSRDEY